MIASRLERWIAVYESTVGITVVKQAQNTVIEVSQYFSSMKSTIATFPFYWLTKDDEIFYNHVIWRYNVGRIKVCVRST